MASTTLKRCNYCLIERPLEQFQFRNNHHGRINMCNACRAEKQRQKRADKNHRRPCTAMVTHIRRARSNRQIAAVVADTIDFFDGYQGFISSWGAYIRDLRQQRRRKSKKLSDFYQAVIRLIEASQSPIKELSDDELTAVLFEQIEKLIVSNPEIILVAARAVGKDVKPD